MSGSIDPGSFMADIPAIEFLMDGNPLIFPTPVTFLIGENGTGKSTILEAIATAYGFNSEGGTRNFNFQTVTTTSDLWKQLTIVKHAYPKDGFFLRAESFFNAASYIDDVYAGNIPESYSGVSLHNWSHGESFLSLIGNRFKGNGLYLMDEPEAALSPMRILTLMSCMHDLINASSQFIISTHSPILMAYPGATIYELSNNGILKVHYKDTEHYRITLSFLENPERMLRYLFD